MCCLFVKFDCFSHSETADEWCKKQFEFLLIIIFCNERKQLDFLLFEFRKVEIHQSISM